MMHHRLNAAHLEHVELDKSFSDERPAFEPDTFWMENAGCAAFLFIFCFVVPAIFGGL